MIALICVKKLLFFVFLAGLALPAETNPVYATEDDLQLWAPVTLQLPVTEKAYILATAEPRLANNMRDIGTMIIRPGVYYQFNRQWTAGVTMDYDTFYQPGFREEYRLGEEILFSHKLGKLPVSHRLRLEQRWLEGATTLNRLRIRTQVKYPLAEGPWYLVGRNEFMVNLNSAENAPNAGFDQDRIFFGVGRDIGSRTNLEGGYQWTYFEQPPTGADLMAHAIYVKLVVNLRK